MGEGVPTVVSDVGWYAELPDDCVAHVGVGETMRAELKSTLVRLLQDSAWREALGRKGRDYVTAHHSLKEAAQRYVDFLREVVRSFAW
jgi:glycosyltransferase involved in cell wall biosynthesis